MYLTVLGQFSSGRWNPITLELASREGVLMRHGRERRGMVGTIGGDPPPSLWEDCLLIQFFHERDVWNINPDDLLFWTGCLWLTRREVECLSAWPD